MKFIRIFSVRLCSFAILKAYLTQSFLAIRIRIRNPPAKPLVIPLAKG